MSERTYTEDDLLEHFGDVLIALEEVKAGTFSAKLESNLPERSPLAALYKGVNEMIAALNAEQTRSKRQRAELEEKLALIEEQRSSIRRLSTPIIEVWDKVLCLPVVGAMDTERSDEMTSSLLTAIVAKKARCALIDVTGLDLMDTNAIDSFLRMAKCVRSLGASCMLTGVGAQLAQTIVQLGVDLSGITTHRNLRAALAHYLDGAPATP